MPSHSPGPETTALILPRRTRACHPITHTNVCSPKRRSSPLAKPGNHECGTGAPDAGTRAQGALAALGALPQRTAVGNGPRGLQPVRRRLGSTSRTITARSRAYRWGEDGIGGISDNKQRLCFAPAFWNGKDPILKERLFGLTGNQGNHGEDVKEYYFYLDNLPSHAYMKMIYRYPHAAYPYEQIRRRERQAHEGRSRIRTDRHRRL